MKELKVDFIEHLKQTLTQQKNELIAEKESVNEEIGKETKSSAGDKFETSREMMNQERDRLESRISHLDQHLRSINDINNFNDRTIVEFGTLVKTDQALFLFGLALGKINFKAQDIFVLSLNSPIGKVFLGLQQSDSVTFNSKKYQIQSIH